MDEKAVWQRVLASGTESWEDAEALLREAEELGRLYHKLQRAAGGVGGALVENQRQTVELLRGIRCLRGKPKGGRNLPAPAGPVTEARIINCYHRSRRAMAEFAARAAMPETGTVFADLADLQRKNCTLLARLLGSQNPG